MQRSSIQSQNGVKRPGPRSVKCAAVWDYLDANHVRGRAPLEVANIRDVGKAKGWNDNNTKAEYYAWLKFHGLAKSQGTSNHSLNEQ